MSQKSKDDWDFYFCEMNDAPASIMLNLSAIQRAPDADKPWLLWVWIPMRAARPDGLSSSEEAPMLFDIEDRLNKALARACQAEPVGRITGSSRRELYYYAPSGMGFEADVKKTCAPFADYAVERGAQKDEDWKQYREVLYPSNRDMQRIQNRRVLELLEKNGDDHSIPREVDHMACFATTKDRKKFIAAAVKSGFRVQSEESSEEGDSEWPHSVVVVRADPIEPRHLDEVVDGLVVLADEFNGDYDGWGCEVAKSKPARKRSRKPRRKSPARKR